MMLALATSLSALSWSATVVENIGEVSHVNGGLENTVTLGSSYDRESQIICLHAGMTRNGGAAATGMDCYQASNSGRFEITKMDSLTHDGNNIITLFKVMDRSNSMICFGNAMTRSGNTIYDQQGGKLAGAGADVSLQCKAKN